MGHRALARTNAILTSSMPPVCQNLLFCGKVPAPLTLSCGVHPSPPPTGRESTMDFIRLPPGQTKAMCNATSRTQLCY